jgi:glyoxylase-like metal-dependent hydrolase (beta-lactamase superfamily II)
MRPVLPGIYWLFGDGLNCNAFIIESKSEKLLIDSGLGYPMPYGVGNQTSNSASLQQIIEQHQINRVLLTHGHLDHSGGIMNLKTDSNIEVAASRIESQYLEKGDCSVIAPFFGAGCLPLEISFKLDDGDQVDVGDFTFQVIHTPGHTKGSICLWEKTRKILVSGDTVFPQGSFGRTDLPTGSSSELVVSLKKLSQLDVKVLLPGHMPPLVAVDDSTASAIRRSYQFARQMLPS